MKTKLNTRILSALLALVLFLSCCPVFTFAELFPEGFQVAYEGEKISEITFFQHEKKTVTAENLPEGCGYQWQIRIPGTDVWVNIQGQTNRELGISYALVGSLLDAEKSAYVRCAAVLDGTDAEYTKPLRTTVTEEPEVAAPAEPAAPVASVPGPEITEPVPEVTEETIPETPAEPVVPETTEAVEETLPETTEETAATEATEAEEETSAPTEGEAIPNVTEETVPAVTTEETTAPEVTEAAEEASAPVQVESEPETTGEPAEEPTEEILDGAVKSAAPMMFSLARSSDAEELSDEAEIVSVTIEYYYEDRNGNQGEMVMDPYVARIVSGNSLNVTVPCRIFPGYEIKLASDISGVELTNNDVVISLASVTANQTVVIHYKEIQVQYHARFFLQNVYNDLYTESTDIISDTDIQNMKGYAGGQPDESLIHPDIPGFTALFHQPDKIAADGSTVFEVYYDRNYYLINFDMDGGYGTAPVYARFETTFNVSQPTKAGNSFSRWELVTVNGEPATDAQKAESFLSKIPDENRTYKAVWIQNPTTYTVAYWILDGEGNKTFLGSSVRNEQTGKDVTGTDDLGSAAICGYEGHTHGDSCMSCGHWHTDECVNPLNLPINNPSGADEQAISALGEEKPENGYIYAITVDGQNGVWCRLRWNDQWYGIDESRRSGNYIERVSVVATGEWAGKTYNAEKYYAQLNCEHIHKNGCQMICKSDLHKHVAACYVNDKVFEYLYSDPTVKVEGDGSTVMNVYYEYKEYTLKFYYARTKGGTDSEDEDDIPDAEFTTVEIPGGTTRPFGYRGGTDTGPSADTDDDAILLANVGEWGKITGTDIPTLKKNTNTYQKGALQIGDYYYHYLTFTARYGDNISEKWPCDVFNSAERADDNIYNGWSGRTAFVSAWNPESRVKYVHDNQNSTIKGKYELLDENLLFDSLYEDVSEVSFLCFWENGAPNVKWNVPELYRYNIYLEALPDQDLTDKTVVTKEESDGTKTTYILINTYATCDDSTVGEQTQPSLVGYTPKYFDANTKTYIGTENNPVSYAYDYTDTGRDIEINDVNIDVVFESRKLIKNTDYDGSMYNEGYELNFYYTRKPHTLYFWNYDGYLTDGRGVSLTYGTPLNKYGDYVSEDFIYGGGVDPYTGGIIPSHYPDTLEPDAYYFDGWYTTSECYQGTEMNWDSTMPDADLTVYAKWTPITHNAYFYMDYDRYEQNKSFQKVEGTAHGTAMVTSGIDLTPTHDKDPSYQFVGWFYINADGDKVAFNPAEMAVRQELHLYAEWSTKTVREYTVSYKLGRWDEANQTVIEINEGEQDYKVLSADTTGYAFVASTRTFAAKPEDHLEKLSIEELESGIWVPHTNSHSILVKSDNSENVFTFWYVPRLEIPYVVRYLDASTHEPVLLDEDGKEIQGGNQNNTDAVVTEQFEYVPGYIPDAFHKTLILSANDAENIIYFYYTKDENYVDENDDGTPETQSARYLVTHWVQDIGADTYSAYTTDDLVGVVGSTVSAEALTIPGFTFDHVKTGVDNGVTTVSGTVTTGEDENKALQLNLYYKRNTYDYTVNYREQGTTTDLTPADGTASPLTVTGSYFDDVVTVNSKEITGYNLISEETQTLKIGTEASLNTVTFFYAPKTRTVYYVPICTKSGATDFGYVLEDVQYDPSITGTSAVAELGYEFVGWYEDEACIKEKGTNAFFKPEINVAGNIYEYTYYALFKPIDLTVTYDTAGGNSISPQISHIGETIILPEATRDGYTLVSWWYDADEDKTVDEGEEYATGAGFTMPAKDVKFTAQWVDYRLDTEPVFVGINMSFYKSGDDLYYTFPDGEPTVVNTEAARVYIVDRNDVNTWAIQKNRWDNCLPGEPTDYILESIFSSPNYVVNSNASGVFDTTGEKTRSYLKFTPEQYTGIVKAWIAAIDDGYFSTHFANVNINWDELPDNASDYEVIPYVIKRHKMPNSDDYAWYIDMIIVPKNRFHVTYELNLAEGYNGIAPQDNNEYGQGFIADVAEFNDVARTDDPNCIAKFLGWHYDADGDGVVDEGELYAGGSKLTMPANNVTLTAVWDYPLIISQTGINDSAIYEVVDSNNKVVLAVALTGTEHVAIYQLPAGNYTVREITDWTWKYNSDGPKSIAVTGNGENIVKFTYTGTTPDWLHGETHKENNFATVTNP